MTTNNDHDDLWAAINSQDFAERCEAAHSALLTSDQAAALANDPDWCVRWTLAHRVDHPEPIRSMLNDADARVLVALVTSPHITHEEADELAARPDVQRLLKVLTAE